MGGADHHELSTQQLAARLRRGGHPTAVLHDNRRHVEESRLRAVMSTYTRRRGYDRHARIAMWWPSSVRCTPHDPTHAPRPPVYSPAVLVVCLLCVHDLRLCSCAAQKSVSQITAYSAPHHGRTRNLPANPPPLPAPTRHAIARSSVRSDTPLTSTPRYTHAAARCTRSSLRSLSCVSHRHAHDSNSQGVHLVHRRQH